MTSSKKKTYTSNRKEQNASSAWQPQTNFINAKDKIGKFHRQYHEKLKALLELINNNDNLMKNQMY